MMDESDAELVAQARHGSREAASVLMERYLRACRAVALSVVGEVAAAEDACQDAFVYAISRIDACRDPARFGAWLLQIVRNRSRNHVRDRKAEVPLGDLTAEAGRPLPDRAAELSELRDQLLAALATLPPERREVVLLHDLEGWTHREIADRLGLPEGTVRSHLHHARKKLRLRLQMMTEQDE